MMRALWAQVNRRGTFPRRNLAAQEVCPEGVRVTVRTPRRRDPGVASGARPVAVKQSGPIGWWGRVNGSPDLL